jgi:hypothetical protein
MIHKNRGTRRKQNYTKARRKARIIHNLNDYWFYNSLHELSKGKIHCTIGSAKTNGKNNKSKGPVDGARSFCRLAVTNERYGRKNWKVSDKRKIDNMKNQKEEYEH